MSDVTRVLEDVRRQVTAGPGAFNRLVQRRRRRRARRQIATAVIALGLSALAIGGAVRIFNAERQLPADRLDRSTIRELRPTWDTGLGGPAIGHEVGGHHGHNVAVEPFAPVAAGRDVVAMTSEGLVVAYPAGCEAAPCAPAWTASVPNPAFGPVVVDGSVLVVTTDGEIDSFSGCERSERACEPAWVGDISGTGAGPAGPLVTADGVVYGVATDGTVFAFDAACRPSVGVCPPAWTTRMTASAALGHLTQPVVSDGLVFATNDLDRVYAFDQRTGEVRWTARISRPEGGYPLPDTLAVEGGQVFATFGASLYAFTTDCPAECAPSWHADAPDPDGIMSSPVVGAGMVFVKTWASPAAGHVLAFSPDCAAEADVCAPVWSAIDHGWGDIVAADAIVYSTSYGDGSVTAYPAACAPGFGCEPIWEARQVGTPVSGPTFPAARDGLLFVPTEEGALQVLAASCAEPCRPIRTFSPALTGRERTRSLSPPLVRGGRLWFVSADGRLFAYSLTG